MARSLYFLTAGLLLVILGTFCSAQEVNVMVPVEAPAPVVEVVDPVVSGDSTTAEGRPKRQFLAGLVLGSLLSGGGYGYGRPYYGGYGGYGYGYGRPYGHHHHHYHGYGYGK